MKKILCVAITLFFISTLSYAQKIPADSIFANYYAATGGKAHWDSIKTYSLDLSYSSKNAVPYTSNIAVSYPDRSIYKSKVVMKRLFSYVNKEKEGWIKVPIGGKMDVKELSVAEKTNMNLEMYNFLTPFLNYKERGLIATTVGSETLNGVLTNQVELQGKGVKYNLWFDAKTNLLLRSKETLGTSVVVNDYSNYIKSNTNIIFPSKFVITDQANKIPVTVAAKLMVNAPLNAELFKR